MNGFVTIEAGAFTGSGFVMEHRSAVTEVTKTAAVSKIIKALLRYFFEMTLHPNKLTKLIYAKLTIK